MNLSCCFHGTIDFYFAQHIAPMARVKRLRLVKRNGVAG